MHDDRSEDALTESTIDREIERALAVDPSPEFLARVRTCIVNEPPPVARRLPWVLTAASAIVGVLVVVLVVSRSSQKPSPASANPSPIPSKPFGDVSLPPTPPVVKQGGTAVAAQPARGSNTAPGFRRAAPSGLGVSLTKPEVSISANDATSGNARPTEAVPIPLSGRVRVGGNVKAPRKIVDVKPIYPEGARATQTRGVVVLQLIIATDGSVSNARVLRSIPIFDQAAIDAVKQWKFEPTLLNGVPIEVDMNVFINFTPE